MSAAKIVMVVDDDEALRESVCEFLEEDGYEAICVDNGTSALDRLHSDRKKPDLILLDLMMPGMNGWQFREEQLRDPSLASIPVVVMTASRDVQGIKADEVLYKPLKLAKLLETVKRHGGSAPPEPGRTSGSRSQNGHQTPPPAHPMRRATDRQYSNEIFREGSEMGDLMRAKDWSQTSLGPAEGWPQSLRSAMSICLGSRFPIAIYWGRELTTLYNDGWSTIPGTKHPWALGKPAKEVWPDIWDTIAGWFDRVIGTGESIYQEGQFLAMHRRGYTEECYFDFTFSPIRGESGGVEGVFNAVVETTFRYVNERRTRVLRDLSEAVAPARTPTDACMRAAQSLDAATQDVPFCALYLTADDDAPLARLVASARLPAGSSAAPQTIVLSDDSVWPMRDVANSKHVEVVKGLTARLGTELPGGAWPEPADAAFVAPLIATGNVCGFLVLGANPRRAIDDDYLLFVERTASHVASAIATAMDYEKERKRAEALDEIDRAKTTFFSNVSHEFRTPLTLILGPTQDLLTGVHGKLDAEQREQLELLHRNGLRLQKLVNALLDFSRLEAGRIQASFESVDISVLTRELASAFETAIQQAGVRLVIDCPPLDEAVYVDHDMWEKIVLNLLSNALKFTFEGGIEVSVRSIDGHVELRVKDTGVGVPADEVPRLFERFHRVEGARARTHEGSGIGLALVQELTKLHGGTVHVESQLGVGTSFTVKIPKGTAHLPKERIGAPRTQASTALGAAPFVQEALRWLPGDGKPSPSDVPPPDPGAAEAIPASDFGSKTAARILLADDSADMRDYVRRHLDRHWTVDAVENGAKALAFARSNPPDLILTDVMMPGLDGFALLRELRKDARTGNIPVIMLSARAGEEAKLEGLHAGAEDYLTKPFSARELIARVRTHLELAGLRNKARAERERLYSMFMQTPVPICVFRGPELVFELSNPLYDEVVGRKVVLGKTLLEVIPEALGQGFADLLRGVMQSGEPYIGKEMLVRLDRDHDGVLEDTFFTFIYAPIRSETGVADRVMAVVNDVTYQVVVRRRIEESEESFRRLVAQAQAGIEQTDLTGRFTLTNERYREIVGRSSAELQQLRMQDITHPDDWPRNWEQFQKLIELGSPFIIEKRYVKPDGSIVWVQSSVSRIDDREGRPRSAAIVTIDITQRKYAEQALREGEERYRTLVEQVKDYAIFRTDTRGRATTWNEGVKRVLGFDEAEFVGTDITEAIFTPEDIQDGVPQRELETAAREGTANNDRWMRRKSGEHFAAAGVTSGLRDAEGLLVGFTKVMRDQTEKVRAEETLRESEARFRAFFETAGVSIWDEDFAAVKQLVEKLKAEHGAGLREFLRTNPSVVQEAIVLVRIRDVNPATLRMFGASNKEELLKSLSTIFLPETQSVFLEELIALDEGKRLFSAETALRTIGGQRIDVLLTMSFPPAHEQPDRVLVTLMDISARKVTEVEREARVVEMEQSLKFSERFVGILGHDLRNPLGAIITASDLLLQRETSERIARPIQRIHRSAERMTRMIEQILDLTRARIGGGIPIEPASVELQGLATQLAEELEGAAPQQIVLESVGDLRGEWDSDRLAQVISNLLGNAVEHGEPNQPVRLKLDGSEPDVVRLSVWNAGVVPEKLLPTLFDPFRGAETADKTRKSKGLGLGLYIVQQIVHGHGGSIEVRSSADEGTTFSVSIPRKAFPRGGVNARNHVPLEVPLLARLWPSIQR